eukprot:1213778-Alexandrium_andersonii.AAC.1
MSDIASRGARLSAASPTARPTPTLAGSAWPDSSPCSPWADTTAAAAPTWFCTRRARCSFARSSARAMLASPRALSRASNRARRSSECRVPAAGRRPRTRLHFKQPAA